MTNRLSQGLEGVPGMNTGLGSEGGIRIQCSLLGNHTEGARPFSVSVSSSMKWDLQFMGLLRWFVKACVFLHQGFGRECGENHNQGHLSHLPELPSSLARALSLEESLLQATHPLPLPHDHSEQASREAWRSLWPTEFAHVCGLMKAKSFWEGSLSGCGWIPGKHVHKNDETLCSFKHSSTIS